MECHSTTPSGIILEYLKYKFRTTYKDRTEGHSGPHISSLVIGSIRGYNKYTNEKVSK